MPLNWNDKVPSKKRKTTDILGLNEVCGVCQIIYHPFRFANYHCSYDGQNTNVYPECKPGSEPSFPINDSLTGRGLLINLCNLAKVIDSIENTIPKEHLIMRWCLKNMHPYNIDFIYSELTKNFDINSVDANLVEHNGIFEIERFMKDLEKIYNAVRFYVALEGILFTNDEPAYNLYEKGRYFENHSYFERYKPTEPEVLDQHLGPANLSEVFLGNMIRTYDSKEEYPIKQSPKEFFNFNHNSYGDYDKLRIKLAEFMPEFNIKLRLDTSTGKFKFSADADSVFDIAWYTLACMISEDPALKNNSNKETRPEGIIICCRNCGKFIIRKSNRQEFCDSEKCQKARNARKQKAYRERKASVKIHTGQKRNKK